MAGWRKATQDSRSWRRKTPDSRNCWPKKLDNDILKEALKTKF